MQSFSELELTESIHGMLERVGFTTPTPIQAAAVPLILAGKDVIGVAGTGTGKTLAFALPILKRAEASNDPSLILCPTRELAIQIRDVFYKLLGPKPALKVTLLIGGAPMGPQTRSLKLKPQIIIATPGRMMDHLHNGHVTFPNLGLFVLDEADRMLDMGFQPQIEDILKSMPHERQTAMFTATLPPGALRIANKFLRSPEKVSVGEVSKPTQLVKQATLQA
ncbi:MAG: DEAD/DEAH box helicase, partial [Bdellovibrionales bacterium]|nr:DEAD/DEAH box helicase [Bdellovibrionales bacterium]